MFTAMSRFAPASISICTRASSPAEQAYISGVMPYMWRRERKGLWCTAAWCMVQDVWGWISHSVRPLPTQGYEAHLVVHAVDAIGAQQLDGLTDEVGAAAVQHAEAQVQLELVGGSFGVQALEGAEAALWPRREGARGRMREGE